MNSQSISISSSQQPLFGARATAMGDASASEAPDVMSMYSNPASLCYLENYGIAMSAIVDWNSQSLIHSVAVPIRFGPEQAIAIGFSGSHDGNRWVMPQLTVYALDLAVAQILTTSLSIGGDAQVRRASTTASALWTASGSVGTFYSPSADVSYGLVLNNIGWGVNYNSADPPMYLQYDKSPQKSLEISASYRFPISTREPVLRLCFASQRLSGDADLIYKAGVEARVVDDLTLRVGDVNSPPFNYINGGIGLAVGRFHIDYAIAPSQSSGRYHQVTICLPIGSGLGR